MTTENHEVVFAIVNAGYADAAMEVLVRDRKSVV